MEQEQQEPARPAHDAAVEVPTGASSLDEIGVGLLRSICNLLETPSSRGGALDKLPRLVKDDPRQVLQAGIVAPLVRIVSTDPMHEDARSAMSVLSLLALSTDGRAELRQEGVIPPVIRFLSSAESSQAGVNQASGLMMNIAPERLAKQQIRQEGGVEVLGKLLRRMDVKDKATEHVVGALLNLALDDKDSAARLDKVDVHGTIVTLLGLCAEGDVVNLRLRMLAAELSISQDDLPGNRNDAEMDKAHVPGSEPSTRFISEEAAPIQQASGINAENSSAKISALPLSHNTASLDPSMAASWPKRHH